MSEKLIKNIIQYASYASYNATENSSDNSARNSKDRTTYFHSRVNTIRDIIKGIIEAVLDFLYQVNNSPA